MSISLETRIGIIGGSGIYGFSELKDVKEEIIETPFGKPSDAILTGQYEGKFVAFIPRHGRGHRLLPSHVNYQANICALKKLKITHVISVSAVGSLQELIAPGTVVIPNQILDKTFLRKRSFFDDEFVGHIGFADPFCEQLRKLAVETCQSSNIVHFNGGTYVAIEGPRFSTRAESYYYRNIGGTVIGMTAMPEACLAREAEMAYCTLAMATDYDCWKQDEAPVTADHVMTTLKRNADTSKAIVQKMIKNLPQQSDNPLFQAASTAIVTSLPKGYTPNPKIESIFRKYL